MFNIFRVKDQVGETHFARPKTIYRKTIVGMESPSYEWSVPISEAVQICKNKSFSREYSRKIKIRILNFYSLLLYSNDSCLTDENLKTAYSIYNSLYHVKNERVQSARAKFLNSFLEYITHCYKVELDLKRSKTFHETCSKWQDAEFKRLFPNEHINFRELKPMLISSFGALVEVLKMSHIPQAKLDQGKAFTKIPAKQKETKETLK